MTTMTPAPEVVRFGEFVLDLRSGELFRDGRRVLLSDQPFRLLAILIRERGNLVTRDSLRHQLWSDDTFVDFEAGLNAAVKRLREALGDHAGSPTFIETLPRRGYRFIAPLEQRPDPQPPASYTTDVKLPDVAPAAPARPRRGWSNFRGGAGFAVALGGTLVLTAVAVDALRAPRPRTTPGVDHTSLTEPGMTRVTNLGTVLKASLSPDGRDLAYVRGDGLQESLWIRHGDGEPARLLGPLDGSFESLTFGPGEAVYYTFFSPDKTNMALYRLSLSGGPPEVVQDAAGGIAFSPDGSRYAYVQNRLTLRESRVVLIDTRSGSRRILTVRPNPESFVLLTPGWSPDGAHLAVFSASDTAPGRHELVSIDVNDGAARPIAALDLAVVEGAVWLPGGRELIVAARERGASPQRLWSVSIGSGALRPLTSDVSDYTPVGVTGDGSHLLAIRLETTRSLWTANASRLDRAVRVAEDAGSLHGFDEVAWAPDGQLLYTLAEAGNADVWSIDPASRRRRRLTTGAGDDFQPCVSPDGRTVVFTSSGSGTPGLWSMSRDGSSLRRLTTGHDTRPSFSPDGTWLAFQRDGVDPPPWTVFRVSLQTGEVRQVTAPPTMRPAVSPDGRFIAHYSMMPDRWALSVSPSVGGRPTATFVLEPTHAERVVRWAPDGGALAYVDGAGGASNFWLQPLDQGPRRKLTHFSEGRITSFDWSRDGSKLAWMRVHEVRDIVAIGLDPVGVRR